MNNVDEHARLTLFTIESHADREGRLAMLPGVPRKLFEYPEVRALRHGSMIHLRLPNGSHREVSIGDYYVRVSAAASEEELATAPIALVVQEGISIDDVPVGTKVQILVARGSTE